MSNTRARAADAALRIVGTEGIHALTHTRVDAAAKLPRGSTSNYFRTRLSLIEGTVERLEELDLELWQRLSVSEIRSVEHLVDAVTEFIEVATKSDRVLTAARYNLLLESMANESIRTSLARSRGRVEAWAMSTLAELDIADPEVATVTMVAYLDGIILDRLTFRNVPDPRPSLQAVINSLLVGGRVL